jgi:hypothetical protein
MTKRVQPSAHRIVRWIFRHGNDLLTCGVEWQSGLYRLSIVANGNEGAAIVKCFPSSLAAMRQHAAIAASLREHGWALEGYSGEPAAAGWSYQPAA